MFIGHYAVSLALKSKSNKMSLGLLFIAVQFVDILFFPLTLLGIEKFNIIENYTESTHFQLEYMPYTHSLVSAFFWALVLFFILNKTKLFGVFNKRNAGILAIAVLSHWFLDLIVHVPDLPLLTDDSYKLGFGLWNDALMTYVLEAILVIAGLVIYMKNTRYQSKVARFGMPIFIVVLLLLNIVNIFAPLSADDDNVSVAVSAIGAYFVFAGIAHWLDKKNQNI